MTPAQIARKLTRPQRAELRRFRADRPTTGCVHYRPFMRLWDLELVTTANERWGGDVFVITDLGIEVERHLPPEKPE